jgi:hypothetical protein
MKSTSNVVHPKSHLRDVLSAIQSIIPGLGHIYKGHYRQGFMILVLSPLILWSSVILGLATLGIGLLLPGVFVFVVAMHAYYSEDLRSGHAIEFL